MEHLDLFERLKDDERDKMEIWAAAQAFLDKADDDTDIELTLQILNNNTTIPTIWVDENGNIIDGLNISEEIRSNEDKLQEYLNHIMTENEPIEMVLSANQVHKIYYGDSLAYKDQILSYWINAYYISFYRGGVFFYTTTKSSEQNKLWAGMAKETAHQIGTPLSSLIGWTEILKGENVDQSYIAEMEKDVDRLRTITERFSQIGSTPILSKTEIINATKESYTYIKSKF